MSPTPINPVTPVRQIGSAASRSIADGEGRRSAAAAPAGAAQAPSGTSAAGQPAGAGSPERVDAGMVSRSAASLAGASAPVDAERVAKIRNAIREDNYPLVPMKVADAMIAAQFLLIEGAQDQ